MVQCDLDGGHETRLLVTEHPGGTAVVDPRTGTLYWAGGGPGVDALAVGDTRPKEVVNVGSGRGLGHINSIAVDRDNGQIYWNNATYGSIRRANADGSETEDIVIGAVGVNAVAIDSEHRFLYWMQNFAINGSGDVLIRRTKIPPPLVRSRKPAPPLITSIVPGGGAPGSELRLVGAHLANATSVNFIAYKNAARATAEITFSGDTELAVTVPELAPQASETSIVVVSPGGITFTLPRASQRIERLGSPESPGFTQFDRFAAGPYLFVLASGGHFARVENALVYSEQASVLDLGQRGADTCFLKNGAEFVTKSGGDSWIFHEPFALIETRDRADGGTRFIPVPAIRPSVVDTLFFYRPANPGAD